MQEQRQRDEKTIHIVIGLLLCALLAVAGLVLLWIAEEAFELSGGLGEHLSRFLLGGAVLVAVVYVHRHRRS